MKGVQEKFFMEKSVPLRTIVCGVCEILCVLRRIFVLDGTMWPTFPLSSLGWHTAWRGSEKTGRLLLR